MSKGHTLKPAEGFLLVVETNEAIFSKPYRALKIIATSDYEAHYRVGDLFLAYGDDLRSYRLDGVRDFVIHRNAVLATLVADKGEKDANL